MASDENFRQSSESAAGRLLLRLPVSASVKRTDGQRRPHAHRARTQPWLARLDRHSGDRAGRCCIRRGRLARGARSGPGLRYLPAPTPASRRPVRLPADRVHGRSGAARAGSRRRMDRLRSLPPPPGPAPRPPSSASRAAFFRRTAIAVDSVDPARNRGASIRAPRYERRGVSVGPGGVNDPVLRVFVRGHRREALSPDTVGRIPLHARPFAQREQAQAHEQLGNSGRGFESMHRLIATGFAAGPLRRPPSGRLPSSRRRPAPYAAR